MHKSKDEEAGRKKIHVGHGPGKAICQLNPEVEPFGTHGLERCPWCNRLLTE